MKTDIRLICFDLNKTLIEENTWLELNLAMGMTNERLTWGTNRVKIPSN